MSASWPGDGDIVVAVAAGARALTSVECLLRDIGPSPHVVVILVFHPDAPEGATALAGSNLRPVVDGAEVLPGAPYQARSGEDVAVREGHFVVTPRPIAGDSVARPIDHCLRSLALEYAERSAVIVLAGAGQDAAEGAVAIHSAGGLVLTEDLRWAPTGVVCRALELDAMWPTLTQWFFREPAGDAITVLSRVSPVVERELGVDLSAYKPAPLLRRLEYRRLATGQDTFESYAALLSDSPSERLAIARGLLPGVTEFFRDPEVFEALRQGMPDILGAALARGEKTVRCWVPACSTGEEAYSIAMLMDEEIQRDAVPAQVRIFATDVNERALEVGVRGVYPKGAVASVPERLRERYLVPCEDGYEVLPRLRESITFARHDLLRDLPFTKIDLVSCRNMLIYLQQDAQRRALAVFDFALRRGGHLLLGKGELPKADHARLVPIDEGHRFYRVHPMDAADPSPMAGLEVAAIQPVGDRAGKRGGTATVPSGPVEVRALESLLHWVGAPVLVVDDRLALAFAFGTAADLLHVPAGRAVWTIQDLLPPSIALAVTSIVSRAQRDREELVLPSLAFEHRGAAYSADVRAVPLHRGEAPPVAIVFEGMGPAGSRQAARTVELHDAVADRVRALEEELAGVRDRLRDTVAELQASHEELRATNGRLLVSNEDLLRTNEELQALNQELHAVNAELQGKVDELSDLSDDLDNLLQNTETGTLFLDPERKVRRFNEPIRDVIALRNQDIGRPIGEIPTRMVRVDLDDDTKRVMLTLAGIEREVVLDDGRTHVLRIYPFRTRSGAIDGVVLGMTDISSLAEANRRLQVYSRVAEQSPALHVFTDALGHIEYANPAYAAATGWRVDELRGTNLRHHLQAGDEATEGIRNALDTGRPWAGSVALRTATGTPIAVRGTVYALREHSDVVNVVLTGEIVGGGEYSNRDAGTLGAELNRRAQNLIGERSKST